MHGAKTKKINQTRKKYKQAPALLLVKFIAYYSHCCTERKKLQNLK